MAEEYVLERKKTQSLVADSMEFGQEVNADKTKYMVTFRDMNAGRCYNLKIHYSSVERVDEIKYFVKTLTNQNSIQEEI